MNQHGGAESHGSDQGHQPALLDALAPPPAPKLPAGSAEDLPVAQVLLETPVPHLDRPFDYAVPIDLSAKVVPGGRVKVRFSGREMAGWVLSRTEKPGTVSRLSLISSVVSALPVLSEDVRLLAERVAERYAGATTDVLRAAVPPRVARVEKEFAEFPSPGPEVRRPEAGTVGARQADTALKSYGPDGWDHKILTAVQECRAAGGGAVVVLPDQRDTDRVAELLERELGTDEVARLTSDMGPTPRYRSYLRLRYGQASIAVGTRSAVFAPVQNLRLIVMLDDDASTHAEPRAPYHHAREVALLRSVQSDAGILFLSTHRSLEVQRLVERGWLEDRSATREARRAASPLMVSTADSYQQERDPAFRQARLPAAAYRAAREGLRHGPVLVQVGRSGFVPAVLCERCRTRQTCPDCHGPLALPAHHGQTRALRCRWCGLHHRQHRCAECGHTVFRAGARGADRTAQELGRAFPNTTVISSTADHPVTDVGDQPALVVSTPGVEPTAVSGYAAALLLDGDAQLNREGLDVPRQVLARWFRAASLVRPHGRDGSSSGTVVVTADHEELTAALVRWDPVGYARKELYSRLELSLPPAVRMLSLTGAATEAETFLQRLNLPKNLEWIGPAPMEDGRHRWLLFFSYAQAADVVAEIRRVRRTASAGPSGEGRALRIAVDDVASLQF
ncbi:primosomal protein N' family DNA-binding protein [Nesterenkonia flava]|uniref:Probable replication restart protein PriA n=1 Tax=Nesterenkonia flava TaxID=469799 RepID=A0ABU1FVA5_9MICC|nr:primosomal protein N' [Nesterenkonia flava]MDR5712091.1 primosomal protein N' [Nesterenkonia flava]